MGLVRVGHRRAWLSPPPPSFAQHDFFILWLDADKRITLTSLWILNLPPDLQHHGLWLFRLACVPLSHDFMADKTFEWNFLRVLEPGKMFTCSCIVLEQTLVKLIRDLLNPTSSQVWPILAWCPINQSLMLQGGWLQLETNSLVTPTEGSNLT